MRVRPVLGRLVNEMENLTPCNPAEYTRQTSISSLARRTRPSSSTMEAKQGPFMPSQRAASLKISRGDDEDDFDDDGFDNDDGDDDR